MVRLYATTEAPAMDLHLLVRVPFVVQTSLKNQNMALWMRDRQGAKQSLMYWGWRPARALQSGPGQATETIQGTRPVGSGTATELKSWNSRIPTKRHSSPSAFWKDVNKISTFTKLPKQSCIRALRAKACVLWFSHPMTR